MINEPTACTHHHLTFLAFHHQSLSISNASESMTKRCDSRRARQRKQTPKIERNGEETDENVDGARQQHASQVDVDRDRDVAVTLRDDFENLERLAAHRNRRHVAQVLHGVRFVEFAATTASWRDAPQNGRAAHQRRVLSAKQAESTEVNAGAQHDGFLMARMAMAATRYMSRCLGNALAKATFLAPELPNTLKSASLVTRSSINCGESTH